MTQKKSNVSPRPESMGNIKVEGTNPTDYMLVITNYKTFGAKSHKGFNRFLVEHFDLSYQGASV